MKKYDHQEIEKKWQRRWSEIHAYDAKDSDPKKENFYFLTEFAYPSGNLHVGHWYAFSVPDILARQLRMKGYNVLYPTGFDAFGLPAENAAIKNKLNPRDWTYQNMKRMEEQLVSMGASFDWSRQVITCDPKYYKWTQWLFLQFFKKGLAYQKNTPVNWCPLDKTVLANEQVVDGKCERCGSSVEQREMLQWNIKITQYADRLNDDLESLDWPTQIKESQRNWIGRSSGAKIDFPLTLPTPSMDVVFATNNRGKLERMQKLFKEAGLSITLLTPQDIGIEDFDVVEDGATLAENSEKKALTLAGKTNHAVFADDSGFFIENEKIDPVMVKRNALNGVDEKSLSIQEIAKRMQDYYADIARKRGGHVDAEWRNNLCFVTPDKYVMHVETIRPVILTAESRGTVDPYLPLRGLYMSKATGMYVLEQNAEEELRELAPITEGIRKLFTPQIEVFTTRPDTLFGATYLVLAPEHPWITRALKHGTVLKNNGEVQAYVTASSKKTERERQTEQKEKTGVRLQGVNAINPGTKEEIPIYIADYVLAGYGTGAIMAVPAHDERDFAFAKKFSLPIREVVVPERIDKRNPPQVGYKSVERKNVHVIVKNKEGKILLLKWKKHPWTTFPMGGIDQGEDVLTAAKREVLEETGYKNLMNGHVLGGEVRAEYFAAHKNENRVAWTTLVVFDLENEERAPIAADEAEAFEIVWEDQKKLTTEYMTHAEMDVWLMRLSGTEVYTEPGILINSGAWSGKQSDPSKEGIATSVGGTITNTYRLRDWIVSRQRYWGVPIPIVHCEKCGTQAVPDDDLPVLLPDIEDYLPTGDGKSPLAKVQTWVATPCPQCKGSARRETDTLDTFVDSSWYYLRYTDPHNDVEFASRKKQDLWMPINLYSGGAEHTTMHVLYSRFWQKALFDLGLVKNHEPYVRRMNRSIILGPDGQKMSKSRGNVIDPDEIVALLGADTVRMYLAFIGPYNEVKSYPWNPDSVAGVRRFLERVWNMQENISNQSSEAVVRSLHKAIKKISEDSAVMKFNTAISQLMIFTNMAEKETLGSAEWEIFLTLLAPFAPHLTEEIWEMRGKKASIHTESWPVCNEALIVDEVITLAIQINGKTRGDFSIPYNASEEEMKAAARSAVSSKLSGKEIVREVVVPGRLVNFVVKD